MAKVEHATQGKNASQEFLDSKQYARKSVERYERIFGKDFVSTGGPTTTEYFCNRIFNGFADKYGSNNKGPYTVLDIGCGIGGSAFFMAKNYNIKTVTGIDLSSNMIQIANEKLLSYKSNMNELNDSKNNDDNNKDKDNVWTNKVNFICGDALKQEFLENSFDLIYSRDTLLHIYNKSELFKLCFKWLKPNGILFISDYCCSEPTTHSIKFQEYIAKRGYHLHTPMSYGKIIGDSGFESVLVEDRTKHFISILKNEKNQFKSIKDIFIKDFTQQDYNDILQGWNNKIERCSKGEQRWATFMAYKTILFYQ